MGGVGLSMPVTESNLKAMKTASRWMGVVVLVLAGCGGGGGSDPGGGLDLATIDVPDVPPIDPGTPDPGGDEGQDPGGRPDLADPDVAPDAADPGGDAGADIPEPDAGCVPNCEDKECGSDGCGELCGYCAYGFICNEIQICRPFCEPQCEGKLCGPDGCNGLCGECKENEVCGADFTCVLKDCVPKCDGRVCGPDSCGGKCGDCEEGFLCLADGQCTEDLNCYDITATGTCVGNQLLFCQDGVLQKVECDTSQGLVCAYSAAGKKHDCVIPEQCQPQCAGKNCGPDKCGGTCGTCGEDLVCSTGGLCGTPCDGVTSTGVCLDANTKLAFCHQEILLIHDCYNPERLFCKWNPSAAGGAGAYDCLP